RAQERREKQDREDHNISARTLKDIILGKITAAEALGIEVDKGADEEEPVDEVVDSGNDHHASKVADLLVESGKHPDRQSALDHLLHTAHGAATLRRLSKSEDSTAMNFTDKLRDLAKRAGVIAIAKVLVEDDDAHGISEHEFAEIVTEQAKRDNPELT